MDPATMALLAQILAGQGGDPSSAYMDPILSYLTGNYQSERLPTDEELLKMYAPDLTYFLNLEDTNDVRRRAAEMIGRGQSAYAVATELKKPDGFGSDKDWLAFLLQLGDQQTKFIEKKLAVDSTQDPFQRVGLPGANQAYTDEEIYALAPGQFDSQLKKVSAAESRGSRARAADEAALRRYITESERDFESVRSALKDGVGSPSPWNPEAWLVPRGPLADWLGPERPEPVKEFERLRKNKKNLSPLEKEIMDKYDGRWARMSSRPEDLAFSYFSDVRDAKQKQFEQQLNRDARVRDYAVGGDKYEALRAKVMLDMARSAAQEQGRSPLSDALVKTAMLKRVIGT